MKDSTTSHPPRNTPDASENRLSAAASAASSELSGLKIKLHRSLRQFPDFPTKGILFEDILPLFRDPHLHRDLIRALGLFAAQHYGGENKPDVVIGLDARGFLFAPTLALKLGVGFVPVRKHGKLPGPTESASFQKEYGEDFFQIQSDAIEPGQKVLVVDDIIATGMC
jgi:adenine phosphoribosyltransferase